MKKSILLCGLLLGFFTTKIKNPWEYPLNVIEEVRLPEYQAAKF